MTMTDVYEVAAEEAQDLRFHDIVKDFQGAPQGDILILRVPSIEDRDTIQSYIRSVKGGWGEQFRAGKLGRRTEERQLIAGTSLGSRHMLRGEDMGVLEVYAPDVQTAGPLEGPSIRASGRFVVTHPEHAHPSLPAGEYVVLYSRDLAAERLARVQD